MGGPYVSKGRPLVVHFPYERWMCERTLTNEEILKFYYSNSLMDLPILVQHYKYAFILDLYFDL